MTENNMTDNEIKKALERLKSTKDYLKEQYQEQVKKCPYPELKPIAKQTYEDNKKAFDIAIKAIEEFNRLQAENERLKFEVKLLTEKSITAKYPHSVSVSKGIILTKDWDDYEKLIADIANEAHKECIEKLKEKTKGLIGQNFLDDFLKEMVGEDK